MATRGGVGARTGMRRSTRIGPAISLIHIIYYSTTCTGATGDRAHLHYPNDPHHLHSWPVSSRFSTP